MKLALSRKNLWEKLPYGMKRGFGAALGAVPLELMLGRRFRRLREWLTSSQWWDPEQIRAYQVKQLQRICRIAKKSAFYREQFNRIDFDPEAIRSPEDLRGLPTIDKQTVNTQLEAMLTRSPASRGVDYTTTGGTGGQPLRFYIDAGRSAIEYAYLTSSWQRAGWRLGMPLAVFRGRVVEPGRDGLRHNYDPLLRHHYYSNFHMTDENLDRYLEHMATIGPCFLHVYPSSVTTLARFVRRTGTALPRNIRGVIAESEIVYPDQRRLIEEVFCCRVFSCYGHTEKLILAVECEHSSDYHVWPTYGFFELLDEAGRPVTTPGQRGEIVGTGFINTVIPFIRYRTGDFATFVSDQCDACGRAHPVIRDIQGHRTQEYLVTADGSEISWTALNMHDDTFDNVLQFQFYQDTPGRAVLRIVPAAGFGETDRQRICSNLDRKLKGLVQFDVSLVHSIPLSPRGKAVYADQRIPHQEQANFSASGRL